MADLGTDLDWADDAVSPLFPTCSGRRALALCCCRRLMTARDSVDWARDEGYDLRQLINSKIPASRAAAMVEAELIKDERVESVTAEIEVGEDGTYACHVTLDDGDGPFDFVMSVDAAAVSLVSLQEAA
jgi:hypothetical protein